jgi:hypothetical protein
MPSIQDVIRKAPVEIATEFVLLRGPLSRGRKEDEFIVQLDTIRQRHWAIFRIQDVIGDLREVPEDEIEATERGSKIFEVMLKRGCRCIYAREIPYKVGVDPTPRGPEDLMIGAIHVKSVRATKRSLSEILKSAEHRVEQEYTVFYGAIFRGFNKTEFILQPNLLEPRAWAIVNTADVVDPDSIESIPKELMKYGQRDQDFFLVKIRNGATIRTVWAKPCTLDPLTSTRPTQTCLGGCSCSERSTLINSSAPVGNTASPGPEVAWQGDCKAVNGTCSDGKSGYPCTGSGTTCKAGVWPFNCTGTCTTKTDSFWNCVCDCC